MKSKLILTLLFLVVASSSIASTLTHRNWRWRADTPSEVASPADWLAPENTSLTLNDGSIIRLRIKIQREQVKPGLEESKNLKWSVTPAVDASFKDVNNIGTTNPFVLVSSAHVADNTPTTEQISTYGAVPLTFFPGKVISTFKGFGEGVGFNFGGNESTEIEYVIKATSNAVANTTYYFKSDNADTQTTLDPNQTGLPHLKTSTTFTLPVDFVSFIAKNESNGVKLEWVTAAEINNDYFEINRSNDGKNWNNIITVFGKGDTKESNKYTDYDKNPILGINYYQLKQYDKNGDAKVLDIKSVNTSLNVSGISLKVYPNPTPSDINFSLTGYNGKHVKVSIVDFGGKTIHKEVLKSQESNEIYKLNINKKPASGVYIVQVVGDNFSISKELIVQ